jgi:hypothetical protein
VVTGGDDQGVPAAIGGSGCRDHLSAGPRLLPNILVDCLARIWVLDEG